MTYPPLQQPTSPEPTASTPVPSAPLPSGVPVASGPPLPPYGTPAPYYPPAQPQYGVPPAPRRGGFGRGFGQGLGVGIGLGATLLVLGVLSSVIMAATMVGLAGSMSGVRQVEMQPVRTIWGNDAAKHTLQAISISGPILADGGDGMTLGAATYGYEVAQRIDAVGEADAEGIVLLINTPGGSINGSRAIADAIARYRQRTGLKVFAFVQGMSASGGMYAMAGANLIVADHGSLVGSIGVIAGPFERYKDVTAITGSMLTSGVVTSGGITSEYLTQGTGKDFGSPFRDMSAEERSIFMTGLANEYKNFVDWVASHRAIPADVITGTIGAHIYDGATAKKLRLIDDQLGREDAFRRFADESGFTPQEIKIVQDEPPGFWAQLLGAQARVFGSAPAAVAVDGRARATASMCSGGPVILAYQGSLVGVCG